jgi:hypothetical protein
MRVRARVKKVIEFEVRRAGPSDADDIAATHRDSIRSIGALFYSDGIVRDWAAPLTGNLCVKAMDLGEVFYIAVGEMDGKRAVLGFASHRVEMSRHRTAVYVRGAVSRRRVGFRRGRGVSGER